MGSEAISRGPRGGTPVRSNRREMRSEEDIGEEMLCTVEDQSFLLCVVLCCEFLIALFCPSSFTKIPNLQNLQFQLNATFLSDLRTAELPRSMA